jgi:uncharacterized LabA/DUF88 family protein
MKERITIYIDGGNFYHLVLKKLGVENPDFDFEGFAHFLSNGRDIVLDGKRYYVGTVREKENNPKSKESMAIQTKLFTNLISDSWVIKTSKLREREEKLVIDSRVDNFKKIKELGFSEIRYRRDREKGIDVKIVTDLFMGAIDNKYDTAIIVSSDTDLVPAIDSLRMRLKKKVEYVGFSIVDPNNINNATKPILGMIKRTDLQRSLIESDLRKFIKQKLL